MNLKQNLDSKQSKWEMQFGQQKGIEHEWKLIIRMNNWNEQKYRIDCLVSFLENNSKENGFFGANQKIYYNSTKAFKIDDLNIYYTFFKALKKWNIISKNLGNKNYDGEIIFKAIKDTIDVLFKNSLMEQKSIRFVNFEKMLNAQSIKNQKEI